ncbi:hypothetical protein, partial [Pseudomonas sp. GW460-R15]
LWSVEGSINFVGDESMAGKPIDFADIQYPELCVDLPSYCVIAAPEYSYLPGSTRFSVVRTGAADLDLLAAGNLRMDS